MAPGLDTNENDWVFCGPGFWEMWEIFKSARMWLGNRCTGVATTHSCCHNWSLLWLCGCQQLLLFLYPFSLPQVPIPPKLPHRAFASFIPTLFMPLGIFMGFFFILIQVLVLSQAQSIKHVPQTKLIEQGHFTPLTTPVLHITKDY